MIAGNLKLKGNHICSRLLALGRHEPAVLKRRGLARLLLGGDVPAPTGVTVI